ncbi:MAG: hypothetical protein VX392_01210 [Verrucomicrobiota bacterium]|nr:hypothetical protein [Verrucomicrobiota bacterium]
MFQTISWVSLSLVLAGIGLHWLVSPLRLAKREADSSLAKLNRLACVVGLGSLAVLFITGFGGRLLLGEAIHGYTLMVHVGLAPVFVISTGLVLISWGYRCRLNGDDLQGLGDLLRLRGANSEDTADLGWKLTFWLAMFLVVPVSLSMVLGMFQFFGTHGQEWLLTLHQYTALGLVLVVLIHLHLLIRRCCK